MVLYHKTTTTTKILIQHHLEPSDLTEGLLTQSLSFFLHKLHGLYVLSGNHEALGLWSFGCLLIPTLQGLRILQQGPFWSHYLLKAPQEWAGSVRRC